MEQLVTTENERTIEESRNTECNSTTWIPKFKPITKFMHDCPKNYVNCATKLVEKTENS